VSFNIRSVAYAYELVSARATDMHNAERNRFVFTVTPLPMGLSC